MFGSFEENLDPREYADVYSGGVAVATIGPGRNFRACASRVWLEGDETFVLYLGTDAVIRVFHDDGEDGILVREYRKVPSPTGRGFLWEEEDVVVE